MTAAPPRLVGKGANGSDSLTIPHFITPSAERAAGAMCRYGSAAV
ncbi:hypothetical protein ACWGNZ_22915 (plasmid) [Sphingomonas zeae]